MSASIDLVARRVVMASYLYYRHNESIVADARFDKWCRWLHDEWDTLNFLRKWQLGTPRDIRSTGYHVKVTMLAEAGAHAWFKAKYGVRLLTANNIGVGEWKFDERRQLCWVSAGR